MYSGILEDLELALGIIDEVDSYTLKHFLNQDFQVFEKPDLTPVSEIDRQAEQMIREYLATHRPEDQIYGEEYGSNISGSILENSGTENDDRLTIETPALTKSVPTQRPITRRGPGRPRKDSYNKILPEVPKRRWIIDPIDGTKNYVRGVPVWATLLALEVDGEIVVGVVSAPALSRRWWAGRKMGAWTQFAQNTPYRIQVSEVKELSDMSVSYSSISSWAQLSKQENMNRLLKQAWRNRAYGDFWSYMLVAEGTVDVALEPELELYDMAALVPIVEEAGGKFTGVNGKPGCWQGNAIATNGHLHQDCLDIING